MILIFLAALLAACGGAKLDRTYLPPPSAVSAGGSPGSIQAPLSRTLDKTPEDVPSGGFINEHQGVVVDAASADTRASNQPSGLGGSRVNYGSTDSKVGEAAFRVTQHTQISTTGNEPDLSAFHQRPSSNRPNTQIIGHYNPNTIKYHNDFELNKFNYGFETDNGIKASESGTAHNGVQGGYSYTGDDGRVYSVTYVADKHGFRAMGSHLPTPPPIPLAILKSLEQNAKDEAAGIIDDGSYDAKKYNTYDDYSDYNGKYNDRHSNKISKRPGYNEFINQKQQAFVSSNFNGQVGLNTGASKDTSKSQSNLTGASRFNKTSNGNTLSLNFGGTSIDSRNDFPVNKGMHKENTQSHTASTASASVGANIVEAKPLSQQELQTQTSFGNTQSTFARPSSYDATLGVVTTQSNSFGNPNMGSSINFGVVNKQFSSGQSNEPTKTSPSFSPQQFHSTNVPIQTTQNFNTASVYLTTVPAEIISYNNQNFAQHQYTNNPSSTFMTSFPNSIPTKQPAITLSTPFETLENNSKLGSSDSRPTTSSRFSSSQDTTNIQNQFPQKQIKETFTTNLPATLSSNTVSSSSTTSLNTQPQTVYQRIDSTKVTEFPQRNEPQISQAVLSLNNHVTRFNEMRNTNSELTTNTQQSNSQTTQFTGQPLDASYHYNIPSTPFISSFTQTEPNKYSSDSFSQYNKVTQPNSPQDTTFYSQYHSHAGFNKYSTPPTTSVFSPTTNEEQTSTYTNNGETQVSLSSYNLNAPPGSNNAVKPINRFNTEPPQISLNTASHQSNLASLSTATTQFGTTKEQFPLQTQYTTFGAQTSTQGNFDANENTIPQFHPSRPQQQQSFNYNPSNFFPSTMSLNTQKQEFETLSTLPQQTELGHTNTQTDIFDDKKTTISLFKQPETQFNERISTAVPTFTQSGIYDQTQHTDLSHAVSTNFADKETTKSQFQQTIPQLPSRFGYKPPSVTMSQTQITQLNTQTTNDQFGFTNTQLPTTYQPNTFLNNKMITQYQTFNQQSTTPSTTDYTQSVTGSSNGFGGVYDYKKPETEVSTTSKNGINKFTEQFISTPQTEQTLGFVERFQNEKMTTASHQMSTVNSEYNTGSTSGHYPQTQSTFLTQGQNTAFTAAQDLADVSKVFTTGENNEYTKPIQGFSETNRMSTTGEIYEYTKPGKGLSEVEGTSTVGEIYNYNKHVQDFSDPNSDSTSEDNNEYTKPAGFDGHTESDKMSTPAEVYQYTKPSQVITDNKPTTGEIYEYTKPVQGLTQKTTQGFQAIIQSNKNNFNLENNPSTSDSLQTTSTNFETQSTLEPLKTDVTYQSTFSQEKLSSSSPLESRPFPFQSACCKGIQVQSSQLTTTTEVTTEINQSSTNSFDYNRTTQNKEQVIEQTQDITSSNFKDFNPHIGSQAFAGVGEKFGGPRKPPCADETGYHY